MFLNVNGCVLVPDEDCDNCSNTKIVILYVKLYLLFVSIDKDLICIGMNNEQRGFQSVLGVFNVGFPMVEPQTFKRYQSRGKTVINLHNSREILSIQIKDC